MRQARIFLAALALSGVACDDEPAGVEDGELIRLRLIATRSVPEFPAGLALSPNGEWLAVSGDNGNALVLFEADIYDSVGTFTEFVEPHGVAISQGNDLVVVADRTGPTKGLELPSLEMRFEVDFRGIMVLNDPNTNDFYVTGRSDHIIRLSPDGEEKARFLGDPIGIALSPDGSRLYVASENPDHRIFTLQTPTLEVLDEQPLPLRSGEGAIIPLRSGQVKVIGSPGVGTIGPLLSVLYDPLTGEVGALDTIDPTRSGLVFGGGTPWAAIGGGLVVVPMNLGVLVFDDATGEAVDRLVVEDFPDLNGLTPCCDVVYDPRRDRVIFTNVEADEIHVFEIER